MKKLSIIVSIVLAAACLYASCYTGVFAAEVYTTVIPAKYVAEDLQTELEVGTSIYFETHEIIRPNSAIVKNGIPMFDPQKFRQHQAFLIVNITLSKLLFLR